MSVVTRRTAKPIPEDEMSLAQIVAEMQKLREIMDRDQAEIDRLKVETRAIAAETREILRELKLMVNPC